MNNAKAKTSDKETAKSKFSSLGEALEQHKNDPPLEFIWEGIKANGGLTFLIGPPKSGKTILAEILGFHLAGGADSFLEAQILKQHRVLMVSMEESIVSRILRSRKQIDGLIADGVNIEQIENEFNIVNEEFPRYLDHKSQMQILINTIQESGAEVVIIDSLSRMYSGSIEKSEVAQRVVQPLKDLADDLSIPIIIIHHTIKLKEDAEFDLNTMAGSRFVAQECDAVIGVRKTRSGLRYIKPLAYRYADDTVEFVRTFEIDENCLVRHTGNMQESEVLNMSDGRRTTKKKELIADFIIAKKEVSSQDLEQEFVKTKQMGRSTMFLHLNDITNENPSIKRSDHGVYSFTEARRPVAK